MHIRNYFLHQKIYLIAFFCLISGSLSAQSSWYFTPSDVNALHNTAADFRIFYGKDQLQFAELRLPKTSDLHPVAIIIHGGCWTSKFANLENTAAIADALRDIGFATWNIEYRGEDNEGGGWPGTFEDIANAADFLRNISHQYSLDLNKVIVIGHSAGGHLALWLAGRHRLAPSSQLYKQNPLSLRGVISLGGVPDLKAFRKQGEQICGSDVIGKLLGDNEEQIASRYNDTSPANLLPLSVQQILIYGTEDKAVPAHMFNSYLRMARNSGDDIKLISVKYAGHHEYIVPNSVTWTAILSAAKSLVNK